MTDLAATSPARSLPLPLRIALLLVAVPLFLLCLGIVLGMAAAAIQHGGLEIRGALLLVAAAIGAAVIGWGCWRLSAHWRGPGRSAYDKRYSKMMVALVASSLPIGVMLGAAGNSKPHETLFSNAPLDPLLAALAAASLVIVLGGGLVVYHRSIDDHEQQAYLWANSLAFYFLTLAMPAAWLLARGGLIAPIGFGSAMVILLFAFVINFAAWAWLKYR